MIELTADKVLIRGPSADGGYTLTFYIGEYEQAKVAEVMRIPQMTEIKLQVYVADYEGTLTKLVTELPSMKEIKKILKEKDKEKQYILEGGEN